MTKRQAKRQKAEPMRCREKLVESWKSEERRTFAGWNFSYLDGRMLEDQPPWSYLSRAATLMKESSSVIDMGTGGGERLLELREHWPEKVVATEGYPPNVRLAVERLTPLGVGVKDIQLTRHDLMPFVGEEFDLVLNRHSGFNSEEIARILIPGGTFLTQQIDGLWAHDLLAAFDANPQWPDATLANSVSWLEAADLTIVATEEWSGNLAFSDVGAIVYYLKAVPWLVPGFSVETHLDYLEGLQDKLEDGKDLRFEARKYLVEARKPYQRQG